MMLLVATGAVYANRCAMSDNCGNVYFTDKSFR